MQMINPFSSKLKRFAYNPKSQDDMKKIMRIAQLYHNWIFPDDHTTEYSNTVHIHIEAGPRDVDFEEENGGRIFMYKDAHYDGAIIVTRDEFITKLKEIK